MAKTHAFRTLRRRTDGDGGQYILVKPAAALTYGQPVIIDKSISGWVSLALNADMTGHYALIGVPTYAASTTSEAWLKVAGRVTDFVFSTACAATAGTAFFLEVGVFCGTGLVNASPASPGVFYTTSATSTTQDVLLFGEFINATA